MSRKKLKVKPKPTKGKRIQLKHNPNVSDLFDFDKDLHYSGFALTDNYNTILFFVDNAFLEKNNLTNKLCEFNLNEDDLNIKYDNQRSIEPKTLANSFLFDGVGQIEKIKIDWFYKHYPDCVFHPVTEWFGKSVNTLIIILRESFSKVVGVVKTY